MSSLIRATNLWGFDELAEQLGGNAEQLLSRFQIPPADKRHDDDFVLYRHAALLLEYAATELQCTNFGLRLADFQGLEILGPVAVIARNSSTVMEANQAISRYLHVHSPALVTRLRPLRSRHTVRLNYQITELSTPQIRQSYELSLANGMRILKLLAGDEAAPRCIAFYHSPMSPLEVYQEAFGCEVRFEQDWCGLEISQNLAERPIDHADELTLQYATSYLETQLAPTLTSLADRVTELIRRLLPTGHSTMEIIASELCLHPRTLQRRLASDGKKFNQLVDQERRQQASRYVRETDLALSQIAGLLGYTEQSTFNSAFRRWFGTSPKKFRHQ